MMQNKCECKKPMPCDNGQCSKCGKQTGNGLVKKERETGGTAPKAIVAAFLKAVED